MKLDFAIKDDFTLLIQGGDFVIQNQELAHATLIITYMKGEVRQFPLIGVGIDYDTGSVQDKTILYNYIQGELLEDDLFMDSITVEIEKDEVKFEVKLK